MDLAGALKGKFGTGQRKGGIREERKGKMERKKKGEKWKERKQERKKTGEMGKEGERQGEGLRESRGSWSDVLELWAYVSLP